MGSSLLLKLLLANLFSDIFCLGIHFVAFLLTLHFGFLSLSTYLLRLCASQICRPFTICRSFLILNWKVGLEPGPTYLSWSNMFFYNCYPCKKIMYSIMCYTLSGGTGSALVWHSEGLMIEALSVQ